MEKKSKKKLPSWAIVLIVLAVVSTVAPLVFFTFMFISLDEYSFNDKYNIESDGSVIFDKEDIRIKSGVYGYYDDELKEYIVTGTLVNNSKKSYESIDVAYVVYDSNGVVLGNAYAYLDGLKKGKSWKFKAVYYEEDAKDAKTFELLSVNAY